MSITVYINWNQWIEGSNELYFENGALYKLSLFSATVNYKSYHQIWYDGDSTGKLCLVLSLSEAINKQHLSDDIG